MKENKDIRIFQEKKEFYSPEYQWALDIIDEQNSVFWRFDETNIDSDYNDLHSKLTDSELHGIKEALKLFTLYELDIGNDYWGGIVKKVFKHPELQMLATTNSYYECLTPDTEVLTSNGWVMIPNIDKNTVVAQYDLNTGNVEFVNPIEVVSNYRNEPLLSLDGKRISQRVTQNHRIPTIGAMAFNKDDKEFVLAKDLKTYGSQNIPISGIKSDGISDFTSLDMLKIATQADGNVISINDVRYNGKRSGTRPIRFKFKKRRKIDRLISILDNLKFDYSVIEREGGYVIIRVNVPIEYAITEWKTFNWVDITKYSSDWFYNFIQELKYWDGQASSDSIRYSNTILSCHEKIQQMAALCGLVSSIYTCKGDETRQICYQTHISYKASTTTRDLPISKIDYDGYVYCLSVPTEAFIIRHNGKVSVTGNCVHARAYNEINKCMGLDTREFYTEYRKDKVLSERMEFIESACKIPKDYNALDVLKSLATFLFVEGAVLYTSFAFIKHFSSNGKNLLKNINAAIDYSIRDEGNFHVTSGEMFFKTLLGESELSEVELRDLKSHILKIAKKTYEHEEKIMDRLFSGGRIEGITEKQLKTFIKTRINECLSCLGYDPLYEKESYNPIKEWFYDNISTLKLTDFFYKQSAQYTRNWNKSKFTWK